MHDHRVVRRAALHFVQASDRFRIGRVRAQAIDCLGGKGDQPAAPEDLHSTPQFFVHAAMLYDRSYSGRNLVSGLTPFLSCFSLILPFSR